MILLLAFGTPAAAQQEHHGVPTGSAQVLLTGIASCAEGTPLSGAVVQLFHGDGPGPHIMGTSVTDTTGRFAVRTGAGTYTLAISHPRLERHRQQVIIANAPVSAGDMRLQCRPLRL